MPPWITSRRFQIVRKRLLAERRRYRFAFDKAFPGRLRIVEADEFGAALQYFTGSQAHNIHVAKNRQGTWIEDQ